MKRRNKYFETLVLAGVVLLISIVSVFGVLEYWEWSEQQQQAVTMPPSLGPDNPPSPETFYPGRAVPEQPAITKFKIGSLEDVKGQIAEDELVIGVSVAGEARAYPINMMTGPQREVFNDTLGGRPIAATW